MNEEKGHRMTDALFRRDSSDRVNYSFPGTILFDPHVRSRLVGNESQGLSGLVLLAGNVSQICHDGYIPISIYADAMIVLFDGGWLPGPSTQLSGDLGLSKN